MISAGSSELTQKWVDVLHNDNNDYIIPESDVNVVCPYDCLNMSGNMYIVNNGATYNYCIPSVLKSTPTNIVRNKKIATFEWNFWVLDGSFEVLDDGEKFNGYMSTLYSNESCTFSLTQETYINRTDGGTFPLRKNQTLKFNPMASECPATLNIRTRYTNAQTQEVITTNNIDYNIEEMLEDEDLQNQEYVNLYYGSIDTADINTQVVITFSKTLMPYRRIRISEYNNGYKFFLDKYDMQNFTHTRSVSLNMEELPQNDLSTAFVDEKGIFDMRDTGAPFHISFNQSHRFYIYYGYNFDDIGWSWVLVDTLCIDNVEINKDSLETFLKLKSTLLLYNQTYPTGTLKKTPTQSQTAPYNWTHFWGFINAIKQICNMPTIHHDSITTPLLETSYSDWQYYIYRSLSVNSDFAKTKCTELLQQAVGLLNNCLVRYPNEEMYMRYMVNRTQTFVDTIDAPYIFSYPNSSKEDGYKKIYGTTPEIVSEQEPDADYEIEGGVTYWRTRLGFTVDNNAIEETDISQNIVVLQPKSISGVHSWYWRSGESATLLFQNYATQFNKIKKSTRYEFGDTMLNPLLQVADLISATTKENYKTYRGYVEKIEINYDGSFRGAITLCSIDD